MIDQSRAFCSYPKILIGRIFFAGELIDCNAEWKHIHPSSLIHVFFPAMSRQPEQLCGPKLMCLKLESRSNDLSTV